MIKTDSVNPFIKLAAKGAALLDERYPNWENEIELAKLNMSSIDSCVLGQVYGDYLAGLQELDLDLDGRNASSYGFDLDLIALEQIDDTILRRAQLNQAWLDQIRNRL